MKKSININSECRSFFKQYVVITEPFHKLKGRAADVLSQLLYYNYFYRNLETNIKWKMIFDYDTKLEIREYLDISGPVLENNLSYLRKKNVIVNNRVVDSFLVIPEENSVQLVFNWNITDGQNLEQNHKRNIVKPKFT
jgi:hypothetical protein